AAGGGGLWIEGPAGLNTRALAAAAHQRGVVIEPGDVFFADAPASSRFFRLGLSIIPQTRVEEGIARLAMAARGL
ncbi:MAG: PLP-dependent aminotransferase family protein, partial [Pseudomonadota bacterium]